METWRQHSTMLPKQHPLLIREGQGTEQRRVPPRAPGPLRVAQLSCFLVTSPQGLSQALVGAAPRVLPRWLARSLRQEYVSHQLSV